MTQKSALWERVRPHQSAPASISPRPARALPCIHEGGVVEPCQSCGASANREARHLRECDRFGRCTRTDAGKGVAVCATCESYEPDPSLLPVIRRLPTQFALPKFPERLAWVSTAQLVSDSIALAGLIPADAAGIVGVPRSGMLPAATIATHLHLPLWSLEPSGLRTVSAGSRGGTVRGSRGPLIVIDDTVYGGSAMNRARQAMEGRPALFAAVYVRPEAAQVVDLGGRPLPSPHLLEWNVANNGPFAGHAANPIYQSGLACDFDGIFCHDEFSGGPIGTPYLVPRAHPVRLIATGRPERARAETEAWLTRHGVRWERLAMLPDETPLTEVTASAHKAREFSQSGCGFFLESCPIQSEWIFRQSGGRPVICPRIAKVFQQDGTNERTETWPRVDSGSIRDRPES